MHEIFRTPQKNMDYSYISQTEKFSSAIIVSLPKIFLIFMLSTSYKITFSVD